MSERKCSLRRRKASAARRRSVTPCLMATKCATAPCSSKTGMPVREKPIQKLLGADAHELAYRAPEGLIRESLASDFLGDPIYGHADAADQTLHDDQDRGRHAVPRSAAAGRVDST